ncbi:MAG: VanZ family protein [Clostridium baratii]|uniref:VanZ family protein n=1 Tax=Clostridium baratii TaxID=1561 RepID=UPI00242C65C2|nr:VanZ family protein [Clostridium baratii]MBS6007248.1 VanZ family protein [Clostridium baratii]
MRSNRQSKNIKSKNSFKNELYIIVGIIFSVIINDKLIYPIWLGKLKYENNIIIKISFISLVAFTIYAALNVIIDKEKISKYIDGFIIVYILFLIAITFFKAKLHYHSYIINPIDSFMEIKHNRLGGIINIFGNLLMYVPIGIYIKEKLNPRNNIAILSFIIYITLVEITQTLTKTGTLDTNDIIMNTLGFIVGLSIYNKYKKI